MKSKLRRKPLIWFQRVTNSTFNTTLEGDKQKRTRVANLREGWEVDERSRWEIQKLWNWIRLEGAV